MTVKSYYHLTKPGIVYGNALPAIGGFLLASRGHVSPRLFVGMLIGISLVIASACVINNYIDRGIDAKMKRTKKRALVTGEIHGRRALVFASVLGGLGVLSLLLTNVLSLLIALVGFVVYVIIYGIAKRRSPIGTVVGSISGAVPPVVGYCAASNRLDLGALLLFLIMVCWQMPHFYAIAIYRLKEYQAAGIPVLPAKKSIRHTTVQIVLYICAYLIATLLLSLSGYTGITYLVVMLPLSLVWLWRGVQGFTAPDVDHWARRMFGFSLIVLLGFSAMVSLDAFLP